MDKIEVGKRIKAFMKEKGLTQNEVACRFGLVQSNVSEMINGKRDTLKLAEMISDNYNVSLDWLIYGDNISIQDIDIPNSDKHTVNSKYTDVLLSLLKEYIQNERTIQNLDTRNKEILKQMVELDKLMKGE